jgi:predicted HicB family RNase H-like nuclease
MIKLIDKYTYRVEWEEEDKVHIAYCLEFPSLKAHGKTPEKALLESKKVVSESVRWLKKDKEPIPEPLSTKKYKGNLTLRVTPDIHRRIAVKALESGVSINQYILSKIA